MSYGYDRIRFVKPVFIGDTITVSAEITEKSDHLKRPAEYGYVHERVTATNQHGDVVIVLTHLYLTDKRGDQQSPGSGDVIAA
jgi:acyl dehydratase